MKEGNVLTGARYYTEIRWLFSASLLVFVVTVSIGILNGFHFLTLPRQVLLTHVHAGTLGWITLGVFAVCLWLFGEDTPSSGKPRAIQALSLLAVSLSGHGLPRVTSVHYREACKRRSSMRHHCAPDRTRHASPRSSQCGHWGRTM